MSFADWEGDADLFLMLYNWTYVSPPSCFCVNSLAAFTADFALCKDADTLDIPEGRIQFWFYAANMSDLLPAVCFRNQAADGSPSGDNCFYVKFATDTATLYARVAGADTELGHWHAGFPEEYWRHCRLTWAVQGADMVVELHVWHVITGWSSLGQINTLRNDWFASGINRVGLGMADCNADGWDCEFDDFYAFKRLPT